MLQEKRYHNNVYNESNLQFTCRTTFQSQLLKPPRPLPTSLSILQSHLSFRRLVTFSQSPNISLLFFQDLSYYVQPATSVMVFLVACLLACLLLYTSSTILSSFIDSVRSNLFKLLPVTLPSNGLCNSHWIQTSSFLTISSQDPINIPQYPVSSTLNVYFWLSFSAIICWHVSALASTHQYVNPMPPLFRVSI